jgi:hypothetical protein
LKKLIAIFALAGILLQTFSQVVIVAQFYANQDYIAKNLCENRDKPQMHCNGKCCLKKKLAQEGKQQAPSPRTQKEEQVVNLFFTDTKFEITHFIPAMRSTSYLSYNDLQTVSFPHSVFHPPTV